MSYSHTFKLLQNLITILASKWKFDHRFGRRNCEFRKLLVEQQSITAELSAELSRIRHLDARSERLHPFVTEAIELLISNFPENKKDSGQSRKSPNSLLGLFTKHGSDKETRHSYSDIYSGFLEGNLEPHILEIGLGSVNGFPYAGLPPGGSLKAWREGFPLAVIVGGDIDPESVENVNEIAYVVDQTSNESLSKFAKDVRKYGPFDLIVDDGFHDPHTNLRTLLHLFPLLSQDGAYVIEDVHESLIDLWLLMGRLMESRLDVVDLRSERPEVEDNILLVFKNKH